MIYTANVKTAAGQPISAIQFEYRRQIGAMCYYFREGKLVAEVNLANTNVTTFTDFEPDSMDPSRTNDRLENVSDGARNAYETLKAHVGGLGAKIDAFLAKFEKEDTPDE